MRPKGLQKLDERRKKPKRDPVRDDMLYAYQTLIDIERLIDSWITYKPTVLTFSYELPKVK